MIKTNLPVILLKGIILLPNNDLRLEFDSEMSHNIIDVSELFHDNKVLVVTNMNALEENPNINELPKVGVVAKISHKIELPNKNTRVVISGIRRANICEYLNLNRSTDMLESIISEELEDDIDTLEEKVLVKKIYNEISNYIKILPYMSNSVLSLITNVSNLSKMTDIIVPNLNIDIERLNEYLNTISSEKRAYMILDDIYREEEIFNIEKKIDIKIKNDMDKSQKDYLLREKIKYIKEELGDMSIKEKDILNIKETLEKKDYPSHIRKRIIDELEHYESMTINSPEVDNVRNYIDWLINLPWNIYTKDNEDLNNVKELLNNSHYGMDEVKNRIVEYIALKKMNKNSKSPIICLVGPPGVGKTSFAFSVAHAINRNFVKISVGGVDDESEIKGHRRTYIGSKPGRIITSMKKAKSMNPLFLIDEIDKMTKGYQGDPASSLLEVLDLEQNKYFSDNYIEEDFDLSNVFFITTANSIVDIPAALKDRLEIISLSGYTEYEKINIAKKHLIEKVNKNVGIDNFIEFEDEALLNMIRNYTKESGVRELERLIDKVSRKVVTDNILKNINIKHISISKNELKNYLGKEKYLSNGNNNSKVGVVNGLAYTNYGGDIIQIEVNYYKGNGSLILTGSLGDVMKESAQISLSYIKANYQYLKIDYNKLENNNIHIHIPEGSIPKDGPSAGLAITMAIISSFKNQKIDSILAFTGEITLSGNVLAIGGLKEKSIGACHNGIKKIILPYANLKEIEEIPKEITSKLEYIGVKDFKDVLKEVWK